MASVHVLKLKKVARRVVDNFYIRVLGKPRLKLDVPSSLRIDAMEKKYPYLKAYTKT